MHIKYININHQKLDFISTVVSAVFVVTGTEEDKAA